MAVPVPAAVDEDLDGSIGKCGSLGHDAQPVLWLERKSGLVLVDAVATVAPHAMVSE
ncbi:hypothetical protein E4U55_003357 [Claviceps digitariae]|nr:hypothetical protein E4U55_003357 [Claviceps digitariae]